MRIVIAGEWLWDFHEEPIAASMEKLGHEVLRFPWSDRLWKGRRGLSWFLAKIQHRLLWGPSISRMNRELIDCCVDFKADVLFTYRGTHILPQTLQALKRPKYNGPKIFLIGYNNDDPFSPGAEKMHWRHFVRGIPFYDLVLAYRQHNLDDFKRRGAKDVRLLRSWYLPERNFPIIPTRKDLLEFGADVLFVGHFEKDDRLELIREIIREKIDFKIFGPEWEEQAPDVPELKNFRPIRALYGENYNRAINCGKILLCFLSKLNRDTYTRRCFEIPAAGRFLLAEYSDDLASLFVEGKEAEFFRNKNELIDKIHFYLKNPEKREEIAKAGKLRIKKDGHDVLSRTAQLINWIRVDSGVDSTEN